MSHSVNLDTLSYTPYSHIIFENSEEESDHMLDTASSASFQGRQAPPNDTSNSSSIHSQV